MRGAIVLKKRVQFPPTLDGSLLWFCWNCFDDAFIPRRRVESMDLWCGSKDQFFFSSFSTFSLSPTLAPMLGFFSGRKPAVILPQFQF
jgi:hypothetical protein